MVTVVKDGICYIVSEDKVPAYVSQGYAVERTEEPKAKPKKKRRKKGE